MRQKWTLLAAKFSRLQAYLASSSKTARPKRNEARGPIRRSPGCVREDAATNENKKAELAGRLSNGNE